MIKNFLSLSRAKKQVILVVIDAFIIFLVLIASTSIFSDKWIIIDDYLFLIICAPFLAIAIFIYYDFYRQIIRYMVLDALWTIFKAVSIYAFVWSLLVQIFVSQIILEPFFITNWSLALISIVGSRMFGKWLFADSSLNNNLNRKNVVVYGAGSAGRQLVIALSQSAEYNTVAFIDDSSEIHNTLINGIEVFSSDNFEKIIKLMKVDEVLLAIPSASRARRREIIKFLEPYLILVKVLPGVAEIAQGKVKINDLHDINIRDLLGREPAPSDKGLLGLNIQDKVVMVTGAGGSIGSELCRQVILLKPKVLILYELSEYALYKIDNELKYCLF